MCCLHSFFVLITTVCADVFLPCFTDGEIEAERVDKLSRTTSYFFKKKLESHCIRCSEVSFSLNDSALGGSKHNRN